MSPEAKERDRARVEQMLADRATSDDRRGWLWDRLEDQRSNDDEWSDR